MKRSKLSMVAIFLDESNLIDMMVMSTGGQDPNEFLNEMQASLKSQMMMMRWKFGIEPILYKKAIVIELFNGTVKRTVEINKPDPIFFKHLVKEKLKWKDSTTD